jgi:hypothetical protein
MMGLLLQLLLRRLLRVMEHLRLCKFLVVEGWGYRSAGVRRGDFTLPLRWLVVAGKIEREIAHDVIIVG